MLKKILNSTLGALVCNLLLVYLLFALTRIAFIWCNSTLFADHLSVGYFFHLLFSGVRFDTTAILYLNSWMILTFLLPLHWKETNARYYKVLHVLFVVVNFIGLAANLCDCAYFPFTGRRTTWNVLQEFGGEGNIFSIIARESLPYWYLYIVAILIVWVLWKGYRTPKEGEIKSKTAYYIRQTVVLAVAVGLSVAGIRGGFTSDVRPITMSNANECVEKSIDAGIVLNTPFSIMRTIGKKTFVERDYMSEREALALFSPLHVPADSVKFKPMNVVVLIMEGFGRQYMARGYMPFIESLGKKGVSFEYSYASGRKSIDAMPSVLSSIPSFVEPFILTPASMNDLSGIAGELSRNKGYQSAFFHGAVNGSMGFMGYANVSGYQKYYGRTEYNQDPNYNGDDDFDGTWAIWDEEFLQYYCDRMNEMKEPFVTSVFTASSHAPFVIPEKYHEKFPATEVKMFRCVQYSDYAVRRFFEKAEKQKWFKNTIFVITADHTNVSVDPEYLTDLGLYKIPIVIYAPGMPELNNYDTERVVCQADVMPTVLGLLGYDKPFVSFGQDIFNTAPKDKFAVNYLPGNDYYQYLQGDWMLQFDGEKVVHAYEFKKDTLQKHDVKERCPKEYEQRLKSIIQQYMYRMNHNQLIVK